MLLCSFQVEGIDFATLPFKVMLFRFPSLKSYYCDIDLTLRLFWNVSNWFVLFVFAMKFGLLSMPIYMMV